MDHPSPLIIGFVSDLILATRIEKTCDRLGYRVTWIERADQVAPLGIEVSARQLGEHLVGPGAELIDQLTGLYPALVLFDLGNADIPWRPWIALIKSASATRRIPVLCFGSHVDVNAFRAAKDAGADAVLARSRFVSDLPELIRKYARVPDYAALERSCHQPLSELAIRGLELFNRGEYFEAHEALEQAWNEDTTPGRDLYRAVLQIAVAYLQIERGNYNGAVKMFLRVRQWIDLYPDECRGIDLSQLKADARAVEAKLLELGKERLLDFDRSLIRPVHYWV